MIWSCIWKILKEMGIPDHLTCLLRNLYVGQEATVRTEHGTTGWFQIGKGICQGCTLSLSLFNLYVEYIIREGNGTPLQYSCLENPMDGGAWWATQSMESLRVAHDWETSLSLFTFLHWRRKWQTTPVFLPGESQGWGSLVGCHLWGRTESDTTEVT